jgi:hypothetical protein
VAADLWLLPVPPPAPREADAHNRGWVLNLVLVRDGSAAGRTDPTRWWLIGTGPTPAFGLAVACSVQRRFGALLTDAVNVRAAPEAVLGNRGLGEVRLWALDRVADDMQRRCPDCVARLRERIGEAGRELDDTAIVLPKHRLVGSRGSLGPFDWWRQSRSARDQTLVLRHRATATWLLDGWLWPGGPPDLRDVDIDRYGRGLSLLQSRIESMEARPAAARLVGSQGEVAGIAALRAHRDYLVDLQRAVQVALERGDSEGDAAVRARALMPARQWATVDARPVLHELNWQRMWRLLEGRLFR